MQRAAHHLTTPAATPAFEADALFVSALQRSDELSAGQIRQAIAAAVGAFGYSGCAGASDALMDVGAPKARLSGVGGPSARGITALGGEWAQARVDEAGGAADVGGDEVVEPGRRGV